MLPRYKRKQKKKEKIKGWREEGKDIEKKAERRNDMEEKREKRQDP